MVFGFKSFLKYFIENFLNLIYKQKCVVCNVDLENNNSYSKTCSKLSNLLCKTCAKEIQFLNTFSTRIINNTEIFCAANYDKTVKKLIQALKFSHKRQCAKVLAIILFDYFKKLDLKENYILCYPQSHYFKKAQRGYEHMELIVKEFSQLTGLKY